MTYSYNTTYQNLLASPYQGFYAVPSAPAKVATDVVAATNATVNQEASCFSGVGLVAGISAIPELSTLRTYAKSTGTTTAQLFKTAGSTAVKDFSAIKDIFKSGNIVEGFKNLSKTNMTAQEAVRETVKTAKAAKKAAKAGKAAVDATEAVNATAKATTETVKTVTKGSKLLKAVKGNALLVAIEGGLELFTNIIPTFKELGTKSGLKQLGKSSVKVAGSVGGMVLGAKVGALIGSVIPGAGTAVGAVVGTVIGAVCSVVGSTLGAKAAKSIVGKDELEIAAEKQQAQEVAQATTQEQVAQTQVQTQTQTPQLQQYQFANSFTTSPFNDPNNLLASPYSTQLQYVA